MKGEKQLQILKQDVSTWNQWRSDHPEIRANLFGVHLREAHLRGADLRRANLREANLSWASLSRADLRGADLRETDLSEADLRQTNLREANLSWANLSRTDLSWADLRETDLSEADLTEANLRQANLSTSSIAWTTFGDNDLSEVRGLETVEHRGPSTIGIDTIYRSKGDIPEPFLRGAGVPDDFVMYLKSLDGTALESFSCFISFSHYDADFAQRLSADLQSKGMRCWFTPGDIDGAKKMHEQIGEVSQRYEKLLLVLSQKSMSSDWVATEIYKIRQREIKEGRRILFPIGLASSERIRAWECFDEDTGIDLARAIREYFIPDFSSWKSHDSDWDREGFNRLLGKGLAREIREYFIPDSYQISLDRLLRDLKTTNET